MLAIGSTSFKKDVMTNSSPPADLALAPADTAAAAVFAAPPVIRRADYRPLAWLVPEVALDFALDLDATTVVSELLVRRNPEAEPDSVLRLAGDGIAARTVRIDGATATPGGWTATIWCWN